MDEISIFAHGPWCCGPARTATAGPSRLAPASEGVARGPDQRVTWQVDFCRGVIYISFAGFILLFGFYFDSLGIVIDGDDYIVIF